MSANEPAQSTAAAAQQGDHLQESEAWLLASRSSSTHSDCSATSTSGNSNCAEKERPRNAIDTEGDEDEHNKYEEAPVYVIGTVKTTTEAIELIRRNQRLAEEYEQQMSRTHRRQDARGNTAANTAKKKEQGDKDKEDEEDDDDFVDWDDDFVYLRVPNVVMSDNDEDDGDGERSEAADRPHTHGEKAAAASASATTTTTTMPTHHDLPATLREFRERARYTVTLAIARRAVLDDALGGFAKEVEQERAALRAMRHAYEAWKAEQHLHVSHKAKGSEEEQQQRQQPPGEDTRKDAEQPQQQQRQEEKKEETTQVHVDAHAAMNESGAAVGTGEEKADTQATEPPPLHSSRNALQSAPEVNAELRYRTFLQERAFCDSRLPQFLRLAAPPDILTRMNTSNAAVSHEMPEHTAMPGPNNARPSLLRLFFANTSAAEGYPSAMTLTTTTTTTSSSSQDNEHTAGQHKPVVRREWIFVWKQFLRDIHREVFLIENVGYHDADLAAAALLSYLEHCYSRGQAELEQRRRAQAEGSNNNSNNSNTAAAASSGHDETSVSTQSPSHRSESQSGGEGKQKEEPKEEASSAAASAAASPSANNNALVLRGLMAAGALGLHAALPPFMRLPLTALVRSVQERHTALARLRNAPRTIKSRKGSVELYPRDEARRAMLLYEAARTVLLAGQQSFMAFPYQLLYEQVGMNRLAGAVPYEEEEDEEESEASASSKEAEGEKKAEEEEVAPAKEDALPVRDVVSEDARVAEDSSELPGSPLRTTTPAETTPAATNRTANETAAGNNTTATKEAEGHDTTPDTTVQSAEKEAEEAEVEEQQKSASHAQKAEAAAARWRRRRARMQDRPLMIGEPNSDEFCRFLRRIRARVRARDEHVRRTHGTSGHETGKTSNTGASDAHASLFREDVDGSVYLIPAPVIPLSITNAPQQQQAAAAAAAASEAKAQDSSEATTLLRRGTRIHVYYSETQGLPMVCVSKVFRLATLQPRATPKTSETPEQVKLRRKEMAGMVVLLLMQVQFALFTEEEVEVRWRWYVL